jgi:FkbM family methyltransferase
VFDLGEALAARTAELAEARETLFRYRELVDSPADLTHAQYLQVLALTLDFAPDLVIELGRGYGNTTCVFTEAASRLDARVVSVGYDFERGWTQRTAPRLAEVVPAGWLERLRVYELDIMELDFAPVIGDARRVLLWWDAHGDELARHLLAELLPLLQQRENLIAVHDVSDARHDQVERGYERADGWPNYWQGHLVCPFDEIVPLYDFCSRNALELHTAQASLAALRERDAGGVAELERLLGDIPPPSLLDEGNWIWFSLPRDAQLEYPKPPVRPHPVFSRWLPWQGEVEPGWEVNWIGTRTRTSDRLELRGFGEARQVVTEQPAPSEETFEWIDVLEAVLEAEDRFTMVELGAGLGRRIVDAAVALKRVRPETPFRLVAVEPEPTHFRRLQRQLLDNWIDPGQHTLIRAAVTERESRLRSQRGAAADWRGEGTAARLLRGAGSVFNRLAAGSSKLQRVEVRPLASVLEPLDLVDLVYVDVRGTEADALEPAADALARKVRRLHVVTHDTDSERRLRALFERLGWERLADYDGGREHETPWGPVRFERGAQSWLNPALRSSRR